MNMIIGAVGTALLLLGLAMVSSAPGINAITTAREAAAFVGSTVILMGGVLAVLLALK